MTTPLWMPYIDRKRCIGCGECIAGCPAQALTRLDGKASVQSPQSCTYCAVCEDLCPVGAIELPYLIVNSATHEDSNHD